MSDSGIVISGCGWVTPFATGSIDDVLSTLAALRGEERPPAQYAPIPDGVLSSYEELSSEIKKDKSALITAVALSHALASAGLATDRQCGFAVNYASDRTGLVLGCALAGQLGMIQFANEVRAQSARFVSPIHFPQTVGNYISGALARAWSIRGPNSTIACGNASGLEAISEGCRLIESEQADVVIAGGTDLLSPEIAESLAHDDATVSDGACLFVLERPDRLDRRGGNALASVGQRRACRTDQLEAICNDKDYPCPRGNEGEGLIAGTRSLVQQTVRIDHWIGQCLGAWGASCVAAGIGAARGLAVPISRGADESKTTPSAAWQASLLVPSVEVMRDMGSSCGERSSTDHHEFPVFVYADGDDGGYRTIEINVRAPNN